MTTKSTEQNPSAFASPQGQYESSTTNPPTDPVNDPPVDPSASDLPVDPQEGDPPTDDTPVEDTPEGLDYNTLFNKAAEKIGVKAPEKIEKDIDKFLDFVTTNAKQGSDENQNDDLHPEAKRFNEALKAGSKPEDYFKAYQESSAELNLPDDQFMFNYLKNQNGKTEENENGWSDEDIEERVNRMKESGVLETQSYDKKQTRKQEIEQERTAQQEAADNEKTTNENNVKAEQKKAYDTLMEEVDKIDTIGGMKVAPEDHKEFKKVFSNLLEPVSKESDVRSLDMLLHNNNELYKMLYMYYNGTDKFNKALTEAKEDVKNQFVKKLNLNPDVGSGQSQKPNTVDVSKFASPEK